MIDKGDATWELKDNIKETHPYLFHVSQFRGRNKKDGRLVTSSTLRQNGHFAPLNPNLEIN